MKNILAATLLLAVFLGQFFYAPQTASAAACDAALFIADVSVPDGAVFPPTTAFVKTWRLKNVGTCTWTPAYKLAFAGGTPLSGPEEEAPLSTTVAPGGLVDVSVNLVSLAGDGRYRGYWQLKNADGARFGIGPAADKFFWVEIVVRGGITQSTPTPLPVGMSDDFALSAGAAKWQSGAGKLTFPGLVGDMRGFVRKLDSVKLETGETIAGPSLLMTPQNKTDGYIQGLYPAIAIQNGDRFQATVGCQYWAKNCYVTYRIDYRTSAGVKTLWMFKERYDGLSYTVNIDLSFLAGKNVEFFLMVLASGSASDDQALWIAPRITRLTPTPTPAPLITSTLTVTVPRIVTATIEVDQPVIGVCGTANPINVVAAVTAIAPATVIYHWELTADKTIITPAETLVFNAAGTQSVAPAGYTADCGIHYLARIVITSPNFYSAGIYYSVVGPTSTPTPSVTPVPAGAGYNFALNAGAAGWLSGAGALTFPGTDGDWRGFAQQLSSFQSETGAFVNEPSLLMVPQNKTDGYIQALFPAQMIQNGDRFQSTIGCQYGASSCYVTYRIDARTSAGVRTLWSFRERYDSLTYNVDLDISSLAGENVEFFLLVLASGSPSGDRAVWIAPRIVRAGGLLPSATPTVIPAFTVTPFMPVETATLLPPTPTQIAIATATVTPAHGNWLAYTDTVYQFQFQYPSDGQTSDFHIMLPFAPNTNLSEKYLDISMTPNASACTSPLTSGYAAGSFPSAVVSINGISFVKESGANAGAGNIHQWTAYSTLKGSTCISLGFVLHSTNPGNYPTPPPVFDEVAESAVFEEIMSTFGWLAVP